MEEQRSTMLNDLERQANRNDDDLTSPKLTRKDSSTAYLDGLRGLGALFVVIQHYVGSFDFYVHQHGFGEAGKYYYFASLPFIRLVFSGGDAAVALFFVLSGYVLSKSLLRRLRDDGRSECVRALMSAVARRPLRLYLPSIAVILAVAIVMHIPFAISAPLPYAQPIDNVFTELAHAASMTAELFNPFRGHDEKAYFSYDWSIWTIPIELKGSMLIYALVAFYAFSSIPLVWNLLLLSIAVVTLLQLGFWTMACFVAGLILTFFDVYALDTSLLKHRLSKRARSMLYHVIFVTGFYLLGQPNHPGDLAYSLETPGWYHLTKSMPAAYDKDNYYRYWLSWGGVMMLYSALRIDWFKSFLNLHGLRYLGKVSFMLYLIHYPLWYVIGDRVARMFGQGSPHTESSWWNDRLYVPYFGPAAMDSRFVCTLAVMIPVNLVVAHAATKVLDTPSVSLGKRLAEKLGLEKSKPAVSKEEFIDGGWRPAG